MECVKPLYKKAQWQIGRVRYEEFIEYLSERYAIDTEVRTPTTNKLEAFFKARTDEELVPMMMREFLSNIDSSNTRSTK